LVVGSFVRMKVVGIGTFHTRTLIIYSFGCRGKTTNAGIKRQLKFEIFKNLLHILFSKYIEAFEVVYHSFNITIWYSIAACRSCKFRAVEQAISRYDKSDLAP
jgi:hypothetical protein